MANTRIILLIHFYNKYCCFIDACHPLNPGQIRSPYRDDAGVEGMRKCLPGMRCAGHALDECALGKRTRARTAMRGEHMYHCNWWGGFRSLPPKDQVEEPMPWDRGWERVCNRQGLPAKEVLYRFFAF